MKIYTRTGDDGTTALLGGKRILKDSLRLEAYGSVDELNSVLGICRSLNTIREVDSILDELQRDLFTLGADLAAPDRRGKGSPPRITPADVERLERHIDAIEPALKPLKNFILPGGSRTAAFLHLARTVCRRTERTAVRLMREEKLGKVPVIYLNRLSDLLFMLARWVNALSGTAETKWDPRARR